MIVVIPNLNDPRTSDAMFWAIAYDEQAKATSGRKTHVYALEQSKRWATVFINQLAKGKQ